MVGEQCSTPIRPLGGPFGGSRLDRLEHRICTGRLGGPLDRPSGWSVVSAIETNVDDDVDPRSERFGPARTVVDQDRRLLLVGNDQVERLVGVCGKRRPHPVTSRLGALFAQCVTDQQPT